MEAFHSELQGMVDGAIAVEDEQLGAQNSPDPAVNTAAGAQNSPDVANPGGKLLQNKFKMSVN